jgi:cytochrome P450 family 135
MTLPPGPSAPALWQLVKYAQSPLPLLESCARRHGEAFTLRLPGYGPFVMLSDPAAVRDVFRGDGRVLHSGEGNEFLATAVGSSSVLVLDEEPHERQRRVLVPPLRGAPMRAHAEAMRDATLAAMRRWTAGTTLRLLEPMRDITLDVICRVVLGVQEPARLADVAARVRRLLDLTRGRYGLFLLKLPPVTLLARAPALPFARRTRELDAALYALIGECRQSPPAGRGDSVLAQLLAASYDDGQPLGDREVRDALVTILFAGHDTTSVALAWALEQILPRAEVVDAITAELRGVTGLAAPDARQLEQLDRLQYLDAAIRESLRVRTIVPFVVRLTKAPFSAGGRSYPPGVMLAPCIHLVHRREDLYPRPGEFRPERFLERRYAAHEWFPFGGGTRTCLGMAFALHEMKIVLATLFAEVSLERPRGSRSSPVRRGILLTPHDGTLATVTARRRS